MDPSFIWKARGTASRAPISVNGLLIDHRTSIIYHGPGEKYNTQNNEFIIYKSYDKCEKHLSLRQLAQYGKLFCVVINARAWLVARAENTGEVNKWEDRILLLCSSRLA